MHDRAQAGISGVGLTVAGMACACLMDVGLNGHGMAKLDGTGLARAPNSGPGCGIFEAERRGSSVLKKQWPAFVLAFVLPLLAVFWWWGGFNTVSVTETEAGPYRYAYLDYEGPISNMRKSQREALDKFTAAKVAAGDTISVILTDPRSNNGKVRAQLGYLLADAAAIPQGLKEGRIERRPVYLAQVQAAVLLAPSKAYQALSDTLKLSGKTMVMPTVELYRPAGQADRIGTFTLEMNR